MLSIADFQSQTEALVARLTRLVEIESPSTDKAAVDRLGTYIAGECRALGANVTIDEQTAAGNNLIAEWNPELAGTPSGGILLLCHMDTVHDLGTLAKNPIRLEEGKLWGPGALDMKAGIALALAVMSEFKNRGTWPRQPITLLVTSDEETGSEASHALIEKLAAQSALVLCLEPALPDGSLKTARKGTCDIEIITYGKAAHAGVDHELGRNAIEELAHHILAVQKLTDYRSGTTLSVGIVSGGTRTNVIPDEARALVDVRVAVPEAANQLRQWTESLQPVIEGTRVKATFIENRPPMPRDATMAATFHKAQVIAEQLGLHLTEASTGGGSDANFVAPLGVPVLDGLGAIGEGGHSEREHILIASLPQRAALLAALLTGW